MANEITLLICGTQEGNAGFSELLIVGNTPLAKEDVTYPNQFAASDYCINVCHTNDYIKYTLLCNPSIIKSVGASRGGRLSFSLTIKRGYRLLGEKTPFDLLYAIMKEFLGRNMSLSTDGAYTFKPGMYDPQPFKQIISIYTNSLQENVRYILMSGNSNAHMVIPNETDIRSFLEDTQYEKLALYNSIWVGPKGVTEGALNLDIPRQKEYSVLINGVKKGTIRNLGRFSETVRAPKPTLKDECLNFTISDLKNSALSGKNLCCEIDDVSEVIRLSLVFESKEFTRTIEFDFSELSEGDINTVKESFRLIHHPTLSIKNIHINEDNKSEVKFSGDEIEYEWKLEGDKNYSYLYSHNSSYELNATSYVAIRKKFKGIVFNNIPLELRRLNNLTITVKLNYQPQSSKYTLKRGQSDGQMLAHAQDLNLMSDKDIESINFGPIEGYSISQPTKYELKNGWLYVTMPLMTKLSVSKAPAKLFEKSDGPSRVLNVEGIKEDTAVELIFTGNVDERLRIIKKFKKSDEPYKGGIELPQKEYIQAIEFRIKGYHPKRVSNISAKSSNIRVPDLEEFEPVTAKEKIMGVIKHFHIIQHVIVFILAFAIGFFVGPSIMEFISPKLGAEQTEESGGSQGGGVGEDGSSSGVTNDSTDDTQHRSAKRQKVGDEEQQLCNELIHKCEYADLKFSEIGDLNKFVEKYESASVKPEEYTKLSDYANYYTKAYDIVCQINTRQLPYNNLEEYRNACANIGKLSYDKYRSQLYSFRMGFLSLYEYKEGKTPQIYESYHKFLLFDSKYNDYLGDAKTFKDLIKKRDEWVKKHEKK